MTNPSDAQVLIGRTAVDPDGSKIGRIEQVYLDDATSAPTWVTVSTGLLGTRQSFAPLYQATPAGEDVQLAVTKDQVKDAPSVEDEQNLSPEEQDALYQYYAEYLGSGDQAATDQTVSDQTVSDQTVGDQAAAGGTDDAMTRSEERLHVGTESREAGRARLRKYVVTENVTQTIPVSHEEIRLEREPVSEADRDAALTGEPISEAEHEVILREERPVVEKEVVPVERVRLATETVTEEAEVSETLRKERIDDPEVDRDVVDPPAES